nr:hypothetical protein [Tanacetum cinerariifolium]
MRNGLVFIAKNSTVARQGKGLLGPNGKSGRKFERGFLGKVGSCGGSGGKEGSMFVISCRGGSIAGIGGVENKSWVGSKFMASGEECLDGWIRAGGGDIKGGSVVFGVSRIFLGVIPGDIMGESGGEEFEIDERVD